jgi:hypothetical protein
VAKDSYWFKHDSTAGRGSRMRKMAFIYGHWGKGIYWDVIEVLRDQDGYCHDLDSTSLQMLADLIGCKDYVKFENWFNDCVKLELIQVTENQFYSQVLTENMENWESKKFNGSKGGRPKKTETITESKANRKLNHNRIESESKANQNHKIREDKIREDNKDNTVGNLRDVFFNDLANSQDFEIIARDLKLTKEVLKTCIPKFIEFAEPSYPNFQRFTAHFKNWVKLNKPKDPNQPKMVY